MPPARARRRRAAPPSTASTSASTVVRPSVNRSTWRASASVRPIASTTCDGSGTPAWQADPVDTAMPARSSRNSRVSPAAPGKSTCALPGHAVDRIAEQLGIGDRAPDAAHQPVAQRPEPHRLGLALRLGHLGGHGERHGPGHVLRAGAQPPLLTAAVQERRELGAARDRRARRRRPARRSCGPTRSARTSPAGRGHPPRQARNDTGTCPNAATASRCSGTPAAAAAAASAAASLIVPDLVVGDERGREGRTRQRRPRTSSRRMRAAASMPTCRTVRALRLEPVDRVERRVVLAVRQHDGVRPRRLAPTTVP